MGHPGAEALVLRALTEAYAVGAGGRSGAWPTLGELTARVALDGDAVRHAVAALVHRGVLSVLRTPEQASVRKARPARCGHAGDVRGDIL